MSAAFASTSAGTEVNSSLVWVRITRMRKGFQDGSQERYVNTPSWDISFRELEIG